MRSKGQIPLNLVTMSISKHLYHTLCVFSQIKDRKHIEQNFYSVAGVLPQGWDLGVLGGSKKLNREICDGAPLTACSCFNCVHHELIDI